MEANCTYLIYSSTGIFSELVIDYINGSEALQDFYKYLPDTKGIKNAIHDRKAFPYQREVLADHLRKQYHNIPTSSSLVENIQSLRLVNTFTITTAHQPNIFTGPLYFIYKILHAIKIAENLNSEMPDYHFVPVYFMGSEDADLEELGNINIDHTNYKWQTKQTGAVGRMKVDKAFLALIDSLYGQLGVLPFGKQLTDLFRQCYTSGKTVQQATLELVNDLFGKYGLIVLIADDPLLKKVFVPVLLKELTEAFSGKAVASTIEKLGEQYKVQAAGRQLNLFYLLDDKRERIEQEGENFMVKSLSLSWNKNEMLEEANLHPERFSPNVILRPVYQEAILPNIIFTGGGGELAYWLELKNVFKEASIPYPILLLRNSFLIAEKSQKEKLDELNISWQDLFLPMQEIMSNIVKQKTGDKTSLNGTLTKINEVYNEIANLAGTVDVTLNPHVEALKTLAVKRLEQLEKKMMRAEKRKHDTELRQLQKLKSHLFPGDNLQERKENFASLYARYGPQFIELLLQCSLTLQQQFTVLILPNN